MIEMRIAKSINWLIVECILYFSLAALKTVIQIVSGTCYVSGQRERNKKFKKFTIAQHCLKYNKWILLIIQDNNDDESDKFVYWVYLLYHQKWKWKYNYLKYKSIGFFIFSRVKLYYGLVLNYN